MQMLTSDPVKVNIEVDPKRLLQTSPARFDEVEKMFIKRYPRASDETEIIAIADSPLIFLELFARSKITADNTVIGIATAIGARFAAAATVVAPKPTCERPSPSIEYLFKTRLTPIKDAQTDIKIPQTKAFRTIYMYGV